MWITLEEARSKEYIKSKAYAWLLHLAYLLFISIGIPKEKIRFRQHHMDEKAFYADDAWDVEINLKSFGWIECCGVHDRTDYDLKQHEKKSGVSLAALTEDGEKAHPHILEIAFGTDRPVFAILNLFYQAAEKKDGKPMFRVPYQIAPVSVAIFPLMKKDGLPEYAQKIDAMISHIYVTKYDEAGTVGKRYVREDEAGTPFCITVDYDSLKKKDVTIRERDTGKQRRVEEKELLPALAALFAGNALETIGKVM